MERFPPSAEFDTAPGRAWPTVVELPVKSTHCLRHRPAKMFDRYLDTVSLVQLRKISEGRVILREPISLRDVVENDLIAGCILLVVLHFRSLDIEPVRRTIGRCYLRRVVGLHPKFGAKTRGLLLIIFGWFPE